MRIEWNGEQLAARVLIASLDAIDEVTAEAASEAQDQHWWTSRRGQSGLEHETISEPAQATASGAAGRFGTTKRHGFYGLFLEYDQPFLRPIADRVFPTLEQRIEEKLR